MLGLRVAGAAVIAATWAAVRVGHPSQGALRAVLVVGFAGVNVVFGMLGAVTGGLATPYWGGAMVVLAAFAVVLDARYTRGLVEAAPVAIAFPATLALTSLWALGESAPPPGDRAWAEARFHFTNLAVLYGIVVFAGHLTWTLREQVFRARALGQYRLDRRLGAGGMGEVWIGHHHALRRDVAVKIMRGEGRAAMSDEAVARFEREVRATAELTHPNTVRVFDYGVTDDGLCYYVMELLDGEDVAALVAREGPQPAPRAVHIVAQAARALAEAHARGIVHRDVKPENVFLCLAGGEADFVKVLDFGIAKLAADRQAQETALTRTGWVLGTPLWLAPEAFSGGPVDAPADVYALGAMLYLLLTGRPPREGGTMSALAESHARGAPPPLPEGTAPDLVAVVERCLSRDPAARYRDAGELAVALAECGDAGKWRPTSGRIVVASSDPVDVFQPTASSRRR